MLLIEHPAGYLPERAYILRVLLGEFLGIHYHATAAERHDIRITDSTGHPGELRIADVLFQSPESAWLTADALPSEPLERLDSRHVPFDGVRVPEAIPIIYGQRLPDGTWAAVTPDRIDLGLDVFGSSFFMLSRYEEIAVQQRDRHDRFPASASLAHRHHFLDRPVVNEYVELLWACLAHLFPRLRRRPRQGKVRLTFDVDWPAITLGVSPPLLLRATAADLVRRRDPALAAKRLVSWANVRRGDLDHDAGNIFADIMSTAEHHDVRATFYFIAGEGRGDIDGSYTVDHPWIRRLLREIHARGHEIGLHPTYRTYRDPDRIQLEFERLRETCAEEGIHQDSWGGRQHYLRWEAPTTWRNYAEAGLAHDSTLGFADQIGFRCGTCYEYPVFDLRNRRPLPLRERPLLAMDATMFGEHAKDGMNLHPSAAVARLWRLYSACRRYAGDYTVLWHNNWLLRSRVDTAYRESLQMLEIA